MRNNTIKVPLKKLKVCRSCKNLLVEYKILSQNVYMSNYESNISTYVFLWGHIAIRFPKISYRYTYKFQSTLYSALSHLENDSLIGKANELMRKSNGRLRRRLTLRTAQFLHDLPTRKFSIIYLFFIFKNIFDTRIINISYPITIAINMNNIAKRTLYRTLSLASHLIRY